VLLLVTCIVSDYRVEIMTGIPDPAVGGSPFHVPRSSEPVINEENNNEGGNI